MKQTKVSGQWDQGNNHVNVQLTLILFEEDSEFFVYTPSLDLSGYGESEDEARKSFAETLDAFLQYTANKKTLPKVLTRLGWNVKSRKRIKSPALVDMVNNNEYLAEIFEEKQYKKVHETVKMPVFA